MRGEPNLDQRIKIERKVETPNNRGETIVSWTTLVDSLPAEVTPLRGREFFAAAQANSEATTKFTIRSRPDVTAPGNRIVYAGTTYALLHVPEARRASYIEILAAAQVS